MNTAMPRIRQTIAADGYPLAARIWDAGAPKARVVCLHGIISHSGWYAASCRFLAESGFEVHFLDRRGSGLNAQSRGDVDRYETWLTDVEEYLAQLPNSEPIVLLGVSWGGKLAAAVARHRPGAISGLALVCPGICAKTKAGALQRMAIKLLGRTPMRRRRVRIPLQDPAQFADAHGWREYIGTDPLTLREVTIGFARCDLELDRYVAGAAPDIVAPTLLMLAGRDEIIDNQGMHAFFQRLGAHERRLIEYPQATHTLEFEADPTPYFRDLAGWLDHCAATAKQNLAGQARASHQTPNGALERRPTACSNFERA